MREIVDKTVEFPAQSIIGAAIALDIPRFLALSAGGSCFDRFHVKRFQVIFFYSTLR